MTEHNVTEYRDGTPVPTTMGDDTPVFLSMNLNFRPGNGAVPRRELGSGVLLSLRDILDGRVEWFSPDDLHHMTWYTIEGDICYPFTLD